MKTVIYAILIISVNCASVLCQSAPDRKSQIVSTSHVTVRVLDKETFKPVDAQILVIGSKPENYIDPIFEDKVYKYRISSRDTTSFSIYAPGYEPLTESIRVSEINGTEVFYLTPKVSDQNAATASREDRDSNWPDLRDDIQSVLYFNQSSTHMSERSHRELEMLLDFLSRNKIRQIELTGHTDDVGDPDRNMALSVDRATSIRELLIMHAISPARIKIKAFGSMKPAAPNDCERNRRFNRRVEIRMEPLL